MYHRTRIGEPLRGDRRFETLRVRIESAEKEPLKDAAESATAQSQPAVGKRLR